MKNSNAISQIIVMIIGLLLAVTMANMLVTDKFTSFLLMGIAGIFIAGVSMGRDIWMLIPFMLALNLSLMIPGRPSTLLLGQAMFLGFATLLFLMRRLPWRFKFTELDFWMLTLGFCILQVYARNPVSISLFGGDQIGGRPYVLVALSYFTYFFLANLQIAAGKLQWILRLTIIGSVIGFVLSIIGFFIPGIGVWYGAAGRGTVSDMTQSEGMQTTGAGRTTRIGFLGHGARDIALFISAFRNPLKASFHPVFGPLILLSLALSALSGFRNQIIGIGLTYLVGIAYRGGWVSVILSTVALVTAILVLALTNSIFPLPANIQRSLSMLPGTWDEEILRGAEDSTEWRTEIWKEVMLSDRWIHNKWLGDGLGLSAQELEAQKNLAANAVSLSGLGAHQDAILASGDYHSGPIQTIRTIGYVGLFMLLLAQFRLSVHTHRQIKRCRGTPWFPLALIIGIPLIWSPIFFVFVFGTFASAMETLLLGAGIIKLLENNLPLAPYLAPQKWIPGIQNASRQRERPTALT